MIAWGGTPRRRETGFGAHRTWFYDLSAGPEGWTDNWNVDDADLDGNGDVDYRMPPVWEYGNTSGYRPFDDLSGDLAKVVRYVAIDLLFTTSPLYDPGLAAQAPAALKLDINMFQADPASNGTVYLKLAVTRSRELQPLHALRRRWTRPARRPR